MVDIPSTSSQRIHLIDAARGVAIIAMVLYHATLDLGPFLFGFITVNAAVDQPLVLSARLIAGTFLFITGVSLVLAHRNGFRSRSFFRRLAILVAAALAVTIVTRLALPATYVRFGILHGIAAASVIGALFLRAPVWLLVVAAVAAFAAPGLLSSPTFNGAALLWLGLSTIEPPMMDYVPVLPWVGPTLLGMALTKVAMAFEWDRHLAVWRPRSWAGRWLIKAGQWSLIIYLVHQPLLVGGIYVIALAAGQDPAIF